jgi:hypothetical protein
MTKEPGIHLSYAAKLSKDWGPPLRVSAPVKVRREVTEPLTSRSWQSSATAIDTTSPLQLGMRKMSE